MKKDRVAAMVLAVAGMGPVAAVQPSAPRALPAQPLLSVRVVNEGCSMEVRVNDIPLLSTPLPNWIEADVPVNASIVSGANRLELVPRPSMMRKNRQAPCAARATLLARSAGAEIASTRPLTEVRWPEDAPVQDPRLRRAAQVVHLAPGLPAWQWLRSESIAADARTRAELTQVYRRFWEAVQRKSVEPLLPEFAERNRELAAAFYRPEAEMARRSAQLAELSRDPKLELFPLEPEDAELVVFGGGRLAKLTRWDGNPMIGFNYRDGSGSESFDLVFRKSGKTWVLTR